MSYYASGRKPWHRERNLGRRVSRGWWCRPVRGFPNRTLDAQHHIDFPRNRRLGRCIKQAPLSACGRKWWPWLTHWLLKKSVMLLGWKTSTDGYFIKMVSNPEKPCQVSSFMRQEPRSVQAKPKKAKKKKSNTENRPKADIRVWQKGVNDQGRRYRMYKSYELVSSSWCLLGVHCPIHSKSFSIFSSLVRTTALVVVTVIKELEGMYSINIQTKVAPRSSLLCRCR